MLPLLSSACAQYEARPVDLPAVAQSRATRILDAPAVEAMRNRIAPDAKSPVENDRLWLLAAILSHDPKVATARAAVATAQAQAKAERHIVAPTLTLMGEYANDPATSSPWLIGGAIDLPLDIGGRRSARLRGADRAVAIARYDFAEIVWSERMAARRALVDYFIALKRIKVDEATLSLRDRQLAAVDNRLEYGDASNSERELARLSREAAVRDLALARSQLAQSGEALAAILGVPATALIERQWTWTDFDAPPDALDADTAARVAAITGRADVLKALADYDRADAAYRGEIAKQFPALTVSPGYTWERGLVKLPLSFGLALPPLDFNRHAITAASKVRDEAGQHLETVVSLAGSAIDTALVERAQAIAALKDFRNHDLPVAQAIAKRADDRLRLGDINRIEWADAQGALFDARMREIDALARMQTAEAMLEDGLRRPLEGPEMMMTVSALGAVR
ncbi:MAG: TolC family protein [Sphingobium sp.]